MARVSLINKWLMHYLDEKCSTTFLNATESARRAGYKTKNERNLISIGYQNYTKLQDQINEWLDERGLSEERLKMKLISLLDAKETKFFAHKGKIVDSVDVEAVEIQRRTLEMALRVKGMFKKDNEQKKPKVDVKTENKVSRSEDEKEQLDRLINAVDSMLMGRPEGAPEQ